MKYNYQEEYLKAVGKSIKISKETMIAIMLFCWVFIAYNIIQGNL